MLFKSRPAVSQADPHDAIVAQLRELAPRIKQDWPEAQEPSLSTPASQPVAESLFETAPSNDNAEAFLTTIAPPRPRRVILKVLLAICIGVAAAMAWRSYGEEAKQRISHLMPQLLMEAPSSSANATGVEAQEPDTAAQAAAAPQPQPPPEAQPAQPAATADDLRPSTTASDVGTPPAQAPSAPAALPGETAQMLEAMASDIATLKQTVEELRTSEQQLRREMAAEREARAKPVQHTAKPVPPRRQRTSPQAAIPHNPPTPPASPRPTTARRIYPQESMQRDAYIPPTPAPAPAQLPPQQGDDSAPRPPMPLR
ncbi:MAG: hypothetical protein BGN91_12405 [Nitrobacter sp. 62-13]|uniref:hypothetical protein n=1 Tax=Nitrobacter sp. 62-13 TaxID=1895797 RepID=UPI00095A4782|nr:hypothetical protein [Nitrobacter sp. 62-13]OJU24898.1 MAG: hypothetical protein BGN91_12405 [Nitrobacter sp. 62-13]